MRLRTRLTLWYAGVLFGSLLIIAGLTYFEFYVEPRRSGRALANPAPAWEEVGEILLFGGLPCFVLAVWGGWLLTRQAFRPMEELTAAAETFHAGNLKQQLRSSGSGDELDRLTQVFNAMTVRLDQSFQRVREFTLHASHELKTPLTVMRGEIETALRSPGVSAEERLRSESLLDEILRLTEIVEGLTFLTKADAGLLTFSKQPVPIEDLVREAHADAQALSEQYHVTAELERCDEGIVMADRHRLRQLLLILTDNAVKYNEPGGKVSFSAEVSGPVIELRISNTGPGIPSRELPRLFERFFRGELGTAKSIEGCGLGLSIARSIVLAHGGDIGIASNPGTLTTITVALPTMAASPMPQHETQAPAA